jgi:hypothetical protein
MDIDSRLIWITGLNIFMFIHEPVLAKTREFCFEIRVKGLTQPVTVPNEYVLEDVMGFTRIWKMYDCSVQYSLFENDKITYAEWKQIAHMIFWMFCKSSSSMIWLRITQVAQIILTFITDNQIITRFIFPDICMIWFIWLKTKWEDMNETNWVCCLNCPFSDSGTWCYFISHAVRERCLTSGKVFRLLQSLSILACCGERCLTNDSGFENGRL